MATRSVATVFSGSGFIGRYVVKRLAARGHVVRVAVRDPEAALYLKTAGVVGQVVPLYAPVQNEADVHRAVDGAALVVNLVGILAERRSGDFQRIQAEGAGRIARLAMAAGATRLVHVSAIGADPASPSRYGSSKAAGEQAVRAAFPAAAILRPALVFGPEDDLFNRFATMAQRLPVMPVVCGATRFQPVYVGDVADAVLAGLVQEDAAGTLFELAGPRVLNMRELLAYVLELTGRHRPLVPVPMAMARLHAAVLERLPGKLLTRDQLRMLERDNLPTTGAPGLAALGVVPTPMDLVVPAYLRRYRPGGGRNANLATA
jgi:uncharacterized protein YbjT (DUF2867 family)